MLGDDIAEIHSVQLVPAQNEQVIPIVIAKMNRVLAHRVGGPLIPRSVGEGLFRRQHLDEPSRKMIELVRLRNVPVQRGRVELRQQINPPQPRVDAVGNRNIDQPVFARQRDGRFGPFFGERKQTGALAAAHDHRQDITGIDRLPASM